MWERLAEAALVVVIDPGPSSFVRWVAGLAELRARRSNLPVVLVMRGVGREWARGAPFQLVDDVVPADAPATRLLAALDRASVRALLRTLRGRLEGAASLRPGVRTALMRVLYAARPYVTISRLASDGGLSTSTLRREWPAARTILGMREEVSLKDLLGVMQLLRWFEEQRWRDAGREGPPQVDVSARTIRRRTKRWFGADPPALGDHSTVELLGELRQRLLA